MTDERVKVTTRTNFKGSTLEHVPGGMNSRETKYLTPAQLDMHVWSCRRDAVAFKVNGTVNVEGIRYLEFGPGKAMRVTTPEYRRAYERGWKDSVGCCGMDAADLRGEPDAYYQGYLDYAADREKWHMPNCPDHDKCP